MKTTIMIVLFHVLVEVHSVTFPYVSFMGDNMPNNSYINLTLVGNNASSSVKCHTDLKACCETTNRGAWYFPNERRLPPHSIGTGRGLFESREAQRVDLRYEGSEGTSGVYHCEIDTNAVNKETVFVGLYTSGGQCMSFISVSVIYLCKEVNVHLW